VSSSVIRYLWFLAPALIFVAVGARNWRKSKKEAAVIYWVTAAVFGSFLAIFQVKEKEIIYPPTSEELKQREAIAKKRADVEAAIAKMRADEEAANAQRQKLVCHIKDVCEMYASARQECAIAGNFELCVRVKVGDANSALIANCSNDGKLLAYRPEDVPSTAVCLFHKWTGD
jgi:hypothetical protein